MEPSLGASYSTDEDWEKLFSELCDQIPVENWRTLGIKLGLPNTKLGHIKHDTDREGIKETIHRMLDTWRKRFASKATVQKLAAALQEVGLTDVAQKFFPQFPCCSESAGMSGLDTMGLNAEEKKYATQIQKRLRAEYQDLRLPGVPWDNLLLPIKEMYVKLIITERDKYKKEHTAENIPLEDIFQPIKEQSQTRPIKVVDKKRYLVVGGPGFGKTSTLKKIAYDWAVEKEYTSQYQLVVFLQLRHINNNLEELIKEEAELCNPPMALFPLLDKMGNAVLLLLDGFDELRQTQIKDLDDLLRSKLFPEMTVIISSRTVPIPTQDKTIFWNRLIEIKGFTEEKAKKFLAKYLQQENPEHLWEKLDTVLAHKKAQVLSCPLFLLLIGRMVQKEQLKHITNRTELFKAAFNFMAMRSLIKTEKIKSEEPFDMFTNETSSFVTSTFWNSSNLFSILLIFGEFSWECLKTKTLCFERSKVLEHCKDEIVFEMGILMESDKQSKTRELKQFYEPVHKTFMEFAAALFLAQKMQTYQEFQDELKKQFKDLHRDEQVNLLSCLLFLDEMTERKFSILSLVKESNFVDFYRIVLDYVTVVDEAETIELCRAFADNMKPVADIRDCRNHVGMSRLKLKQIKLLKWSSYDELPIECVDVETLFITVTEYDYIKTSLAKMNCERIIFEFFYRDAAKALKSFSEIMNHLRNQPTSEKPFPEIQLTIIYDFFFHQLIEHLPSLKKVKIHSIELIDCNDALSLPQLTRLVNTFDISSKLAIQFSYVENLLIIIDLLKNLAGKLSCKTRFFIESFSRDDFSVLEREENKGLVEHLNISAEEIDQFDLSSYPRLTSLRITELSEPVDLLSLFKLIKEKAPRINHILIFVQPKLNVPGVILSSPKPQNEFDDTECPSRDSPTLVEQVTLQKRYSISVHELFQQLQVILSNKQILRLNVPEDMATKYELEKYFPSSEFEIDCVYLPLYDNWQERNWTNLYYVIRNKSPS